MSCQHGLVAFRQTASMPCARELDSALLPGFTNLLVLAWPSCVFSNALHAFCIELDPALLFLQANHL
jgi:hypothetical protein